MKSAEWRCDGERAVAYFVDGMALRAMGAHECQASLRGRRLGEDRAACRCKESTDRDHHPAVSGGIRRRHSSLSLVVPDEQAWRPARTIFAPSGCFSFWPMGRQPKRRASSRWDNIFAKQDWKVSLRARARIVVCFHRPYTPAEDLA